MNRTGLMECWSSEVLVGQNSSLHNPTTSIPTKTMSPFLFWIFSFADIDLRSSRRHEPQYRGERPEPGRSISRSRGAIHVAKRLFHRNHSVLVYAGAVMVLFLFIIMLLNLPAEEDGESIGWPQQADSPLR